MTAFASRADRHSQWTDDVAHHVVVKPIRTDHEQQGSC